MGRAHAKNQTMTIIPKKQLTMTPNWRCYEHSHVASPNLGVNLWSFKHYESLSHTHHKLLEQTDED
jgi:hypothetical protein